MTRRPTISVLTLVRHRQQQLDNLIAGLTQQRRMDFELVIASMQTTAPSIAADLPFPVRIVAVDAGADLPLAAARNRAAATAETATFIFLDVDCIPAPSLVQRYAMALGQSDHCFLGEVRYLPKLAELDPRDFASLWDCAQKHPARPIVPDSGWLSEPNHRQLWGLSFGIRAQRYWQVQGMDEGFVGYGGEETDFAEQLAEIGTHFAWLSQAPAVHQWHPICTPPLDKFNAIVRNAERFHARWNSWCMEGWLEHFANAGYIDWTEESDSVRICRQPSPDAVARSRQPDHICFA